MLRLSQGLRAAVRMPRAPLARVRGLAQAVQDPAASQPADANKEGKAPEAAPETKGAEDEPQRVSLESAVEFSMPGFTAAETAADPEPMPTPPRESNVPHRLHVQSTRNNTIVTLTTPTGEPLANASGGTVGFKKAGRSGYEAGYRAALRIFTRISENQPRWRINSIEVLWNGFGQGREAVFRAMMASEGEQVRNMIKVMTDKTPIKIGGVRPKKRRML
ncbi:hypothetical protein MOBT1_001374 [Malassezia obtusa]|uniref:37S ribosomal protein S18, mitochondrial n=1 Tax=Malassezia obtusa TaxID=76774 RepID=A0AAF0IW59_9BASI|nr:hypothetical protein MOBT1_001374 [Malassezia obtusa]